MICACINYKYCFCCRCCCMLRVPGSMRGDYVCLTINALFVLIMSWFDLLLLCTSHTHTRTPWLLAQRREPGARLPVVSLADVLLYMLVL